YCDDAENQYFILLSESTIPIVPFAAICSELARCESRSLIPFSVPPPGTEHHARLQTIANNASLPTAFYLHDPWSVLHDRHVAALLERSALAQFARVLAAAEPYIMNVLVDVKGVPLEQIDSRRTTFVNWREPEVKISPHPEIGGAIAQTVHPKTYHSLSA